MRLPCKEGIDSRFFFHDGMEYLKNRFKLCIGKLTYFLSIPSGRNYAFHLLTHDETVNFSISGDFNMERVLTSGMGYGAGYDDRAMVVDGMVTDNNGRTTPSLFMAALGSEINIYYIALAEHITMSPCLHGLPIRQAQSR